MRTKKGFTLVEIMIVVAIIALLAAIAVPNLLTARRSANDAATQAELRTLQTSLENYAIDNNGNYSTGNAEADMDHLVNGNYLRVDPCVGGPTNGIKSGHLFTCVINLANYSVTAAVQGNAGVHSYLLNEFGINETS